MQSLVLLTLILVVVIVLISLITKRIEKKVLFPIAFSFISIALLFISIPIGGFEGMGVGAVSVSLFIASVIALIVIVLLYRLNSNHSKNHQY